MKTYHDMLRTVLSQGEERPDRTGTGTLGIFGGEWRFNLADGFPLLTTKKMFIKGIIYELLWFLSGRNDNQWLNARGVHIWDAWATREQCAKFDRAEGDLGPIYGPLWRAFGGRLMRSINTVGMSIDEVNDISEAVRNGEWSKIPVDRVSITGGGFDQITWLIDEIKKNPHSRRLIVTGWDPQTQGTVALPPCHTLWQCYVSTKGTLSLKLHQRSADIFLGVPFNIASYALLTMMLAQVTGYKPGEIIMSYGDLHIYKNHMDQVNEQLSREPKPLPTMIINSQVTDIFKFSFEDFTLSGYDHHPAIKAAVAV